MKKILLSFTFVFVTLFAIAQTATDFTATDIDGNEFNLFTHLDAGKVVIVDVSATWCGPCWSFHSGHYLQDLHEMYGPDGTDQMRVIFYEGDTSTTLADLQGTGSNTLGNWLEGSTYPFFNDSPLELSLSVWAPLGFPTVSVVNPFNRQIIADVYNATSLGEIENIVNGIDGITLGVTSNNNNVDHLSSKVDVYPNPVSSLITVDLTDISEVVTNIAVVNTLGQTVILEAATEGGKFEISVADLNGGIYFTNILNNDNRLIATKRFVKK